MNRPWQSIDEGEEPHPDDLPCDCDERDCEECEAQYQAHAEAREMAALPAWRERILHLFGADFLESDKIPY